jgi:ubiquinone biosynthesis O-methyltransferase
MKNKNVVINKRINFIVDQLMKRDAKNGRTSSVLDLGCGIGINTVAVASLGCKVTAVDIDVESINYCEKHNRQPNVKYVVGNAETIDLGEKFDVILTSEVIEHVSHPELLLKNVAKHLRPDGIGIISIPNGYCLWELVVSRFLHKTNIVTWLYKSPKIYKKLTGSETPFMSKNVTSLHENFFTYGKLKRLLEREGFVILRTKHASLGILPEWDFFSSLKKIECKIADYVPHNLAGGWLLVVERS